LCSAIVVLPLMLKENRSDDEEFITRSCKLSHSYTKHSHTNIILKTGGLLKLLIINVCEEIDKKIELCRPSS